MTKRTSQASTVVVPAAQARAADVAASKAVVVPADAEIVWTTAEVVAGVEGEAAPVAAPVMAMAAPAAIALAATPVAQTTDMATTADEADDDAEDYTPYIVGGVLLAAGILAVALSGDDETPTPAPAPAPTPTPTNSVTISSAATASIAENTPAGATGNIVLDVNATAAATGGAITYTLGGADAAAFSINATTGEIRFVNSPNFEAKSSYAITVTATSAANGTTPSATATQNLTITVTNVNEPPTFANATVTATPVVENAAAGVVFTAQATDPDAGTTLIYSLGGADASFFTINSTTGAVSLRAPADFETKPSYTFTVTASDAAAGGLTATQTVTLAVTNVNEAPTFTSTTRTVSVPENTTAVFAAGGATDVDAGAAVTYTISGGDAALFNVNTTTGAVTFRAAPDFEAVPTKNTYTFNLVASDGTNTTSQAVTVNVTDVPEGPPTATISLDTATGPVSGLTATGGAQATTFTDSATVASNATINNFGSDDRVTFTGISSVSFSSIDNDLTIQFVQNNVVNDIKINDIVSPNALIFNEATAEAAVNAFFGTTNVDYFRFA